MDINELLIKPYISMYNCIDLLICTIEIKKQDNKEYHNFFTFGFFSNSKNIINSFKEAGRKYINKNINLLIFKQNVNFDFINN